MKERSHGPKAAMSYQHMGNSLMDSQMMNFEAWLNHKLKSDCIRTITKSSDVEEDWKWLELNAFQHTQYHDLPTINYVSQVFHQKWVRKGVQVLSEFEHTSPILIQSI